LKTKRISGEVRRRQIIDTALGLAEEVGYARVTRDMIAGELDIGGPNVQHHVGNMQALRESIMARAVETKNLKVIAQGIALRDPAALGLSLEVRTLAKMEL